MTDRDETMRGTTGGDVTGDNPAGDELADAITGGDTGPGLVDQIPLGGPPSTDAGTSTEAGIDRSASDSASRQGGSDDDVTTGANLGGVGA